MNTNPCRKWLCEILEFLPDNKQQYVDVLESAVNDLVESLDNLDRILDSTYLICSDVDCPCDYGDLSIHPHLGHDDEEIIKKFQDKARYIVFTHDGYIFGPVIVELTKRDVYFIIGKGSLAIYKSPYSSFWIDCDYNV